MAPERKVVSRAAVVRIRSATSAIGDFGKLVSATVFAPRVLATSSASMVSTVAPVCEMPIATSPLPRTAALVSMMCASAHAEQTRPIRCSFCWKSAATNALAPTP